MNGFQVTTVEGKNIRFKFYAAAAPITCKAFVNILPFSRVFYHARISGKEIWIDNVPQLDIIQENASIFTDPGEVVFGPSQPVRAKTANCFGIYYGEGRGLDACNIFAKVIESDMQDLIELGDSIWKNGSQLLMLSIVEIE